jgi:hypothetical protein
MVQALAVADLLGRLDEKVEHRAVVPRGEALRWVEVQHIADNGGDRLGLVAVVRRKRTEFSEGGRGDVDNGHVEVAPVEQGQRER